MISILQDPSLYLDKPSLMGVSNNVAALANVICKLSRGTAAEKDSLERPLASPDQPPEEPSGPGEDTAWGPKTAETPEVETWPLEDLETIIDIAEDVPPDVRERAFKLIRQKAQAFGFNDRLGNHPAEAKVRLRKDATPVSMPMYTSSPAKRIVIDEQMDKWIKQDVIESSVSPWGAPVVIAYRNGKPRFCVDYQKLNTLTIPDEFPLPWQVEIMQALSGSQVLSTLDALSRFTQLSLAEEDKEKTAFRTHRGLYQFKRLPFGLRNCKGGTYVHIFVYACCPLTFSSRLESSIYATTAYYRPGLN